MTTKKQPTEKTVRKGNKLITTYYRENGKLLRRSVETLHTEESLTQQQFKDECDINNIMAQALKGQQITHLNRSQGTYSEMTQYNFNYHEALTIVTKAEQAFDDLPSNLRERFENDPNKLIMFLEDPANREEAENLGIVNRKAQLTPNDDLTTNSKQQPKTTQPNTATPPPVTTSET